MYPTEKEIEGQTEKETGEYVKKFRERRENKRYR